MSSYSSALSGLLANNTALSVIGDNLANMNTQGFKTNDVTFEDAMNTASASLQIGGGVESTNTVRDFTQGTITSTGQPYDAAIQGNGFFVVQSSSGANMYTRDGSFSVNSSGQLVDSSGDLVQGWMAANGVVNPSGATTAITVPLLSSQPPVATTTMSLSANLDASATSGTTFSTPIQVVDSLGNTQTLTVTFTNTGSNAWSYNVTIPGQDLQGGTSGTNTSIAKGNLTFDSSGNLTSPAAPGTVNVTNSTALADGAATLNINWNLYDANGNSTVTQYAQASASSGTSQNGTQAATLTGVAMANGGTLVATYSNGNTETLAQVAVAGISNPDSLVGVSNNDYILGPDSATPSVGAAGTAGRGNIVAQSLEASNVDMATEFTQLMVYQNGYEAGSKVITTQDQMDQALLAIQV